MARWIDLHAVMKREVATGAQSWAGVLATQLRPTPRRKCAWSMLGSKDFPCVRIILDGTEVMHMISKGQRHRPKAIGSFITQQFYSLAT